MFMLSDKKPKYSTAWFNRRHLASPGLFILLMRPDAPNVCPSDTDLSVVLYYLVFPRAGDTCSILSLGPYLLSFGQIQKIKEELISKNECS